MVLKSELSAKLTGKRQRQEACFLSQTQLDFMESCGRFAQALGFSLNYRQWKINYGVYHHENSILGPTLPQFLDIRRYL